MQYSRKIVDADQFPQFLYLGYVWLEAIRQDIPPPELYDLDLEYHAVVHGYKDNRIIQHEMQVAKKVDIDVYFSPDEAEHQLISIVLRHNEHTIATEDFRIVIDFYLTPFLIDGRHEALNEIRTEMIRRRLQSRL